MRRIEVVHADKKTAAKSVTESIRKVVFEGKGVVVARFVLAKGGKGTWHHHGRRDLYGFVVSGKLALEPGKGRPVNLGPGDFFHVPHGLVHRDVNLSSSKQVVIASAYVGHGPVSVNVGIRKTGSYRRVRFKA